MNLLKKIFLFIAVIIYILVGIILHLLITFIYPHFRYRLISHWTRIITRLLRKIIGIKVNIDGMLTYIRERGNFIISNHLGYLDGVVLASIFPVVFVSKLQVKSWPIFGWMTQVGSTIFIDRERKFKSPEYIEEIGKLLRNKANILLFPEGTSTDGTKILPFQSVFFEAPLRTGAPIVPITIQYTKINSEDLTLRNRDRICWYGQVKFLKHLNDVLKLKNIEVKVKIHPKLQLNNQQSSSDIRKQISEDSRQVILKDFLFIR